MNYHTHRAFRFTRDDAEHLNRLGITDSQTQEVLSRSFPHGWDLIRLSNGDIGVMVNPIDAAAEDGMVRTILFRGFRGERAQFRIVPPMVHNHLPVPPVSRKPLLLLL
jgi:hypothetical protein